MRVPGLRKLALEYIGGDGTEKWRQYRGETRGDTGFLLTDAISPN